MDESTFQSFYERTKKTLWLYVANMVKDHALADDIFQEAYIKFLQSAVEHSDQVKMKSYLYRIATNLMHDHWRRTKRERKWQEHEEGQTTGNKNAADLRHDVSEAFGHLSPQQRSLLWLAYAEGYEHKEIATMLKLREKSIKVLLFRAKQKLTAIFKQMGITSEVGNVSN